MRNVAPEDANREVEVGNAGEVGTFSILANAKAFKALIDGLYSDKPRAIVRELWSNALDSHTAAGYPEKPFYCRLPTDWEPTFAVRDYGVSLDHTQVMSLYTTVFASTKEDSNEQVGKFGLGSKTPFAYTDAYTVTAILGGEKRTYNAFIDAKGIPRIALFSREETEEEQGVEVSFPVRASDIGAFVSAAQRVVLGFDVHPACNLGLGDPLETKIEGNGWRIVERNWGLGLTGIQVRQGCVLYPVDYAALGDNAGAAFDALREEALVLDMPIGSVDITPSRESLSYDATTIANLNVRFDGILDEYVANISTKMATATTLYEAWLLKGEITSNIQSRKLQGEVAERLTFRGRAIPAKFEVTGRRLRAIAKWGQEVRGIYADRSSNSTRNRNRSSIAYGIGPIANILPLASGWSNHKLVLLTFSGSVPPKHLRYRIVAVAQDNNLNNAYLLPDYKPGSKAVLALWNKLGRPPADTYKIISLDDVEYELPDYSRTMAQVQTFQGYKFKPAPGFSPDTPNVYYVPTYNGVAVRKFGDKANTVDAGDIFSVLVSNKFIPQSSTLVGIPASRKDLAKNIPEGWESLYDAARDTIEAYYDKSIVLAALNAARLNAELQQHELGKSYYSGAGIRWLSFAQSVVTQWAPGIATVGSTLLDTCRQVIDLGSVEGVNGVQQHLHRIIPHIFHKEECEALLDVGQVTASLKPFWAQVARIKKHYPMVALLVTAKHVAAIDNPWEPSLIEGALHYVNIIDRDLPPVGVVEIAPEVAEGDVAVAEEDVADSVVEGIAEEEEQLTEHDFCADNDVSEIDICEYA